MTFARRVDLSRRVALGLALLVGLVAGVAMDAGAQTAEELRRWQSMSASEREALMQKVRGAQGSVADPAVPSEPARDEPGRTDVPSAPAVRLPMSEAVEQELQAAEVADTVDEIIERSDLFGADFFRGDPSLFGPQSFGPVPADYLIGPGDQITVDVWGEVEFRHERVVERDGGIILPRAGRISAANRTLDDVTRAIRQTLSRSYSGIDPDGERGSTFVEVTLGRLRAIRVFVVGEVMRPGAYELTSVSTVFTALHAAGGPNAVGSLRNVSLVRGAEPVGEVDLYAYLTRGVREGDRILREGDTVFVPPRQVTVEIEGSVRRPMRYELVPGEGVADLVWYAGGFTVDAVTDRVHVTRVLPPSQRRAGEPDRVARDLDLMTTPNAGLLDGDVVRVASIPDRLVNVVEVQGNVKVPGRYEFLHGETVTGLIERAGGLWEDTLLERAVIDRVDADGSYASRDVELGPVLEGRVPDVALQPRDVVRVFSIWDVQDRFEVSIDGEVRESGNFDWREGLTLRDVVLKAGGLRVSADLLRAEVARLRVEALDSRDGSAPPDRTVDLIPVELGQDWLSTADDFVLEPYDRISVRQLPWWETQRVVDVRGEVMYPGRYALESPDERISSVIARAGGLKPEAYLEGARLERAVDGIGRVALSLEKALDDVGSAHDVILERGDEVVVPAMPYTVKVTGAVNFPTSVVWDGGLGLSDYVSRAGGYGESADKWKTHVVYANGESRPIRRWWPDPGVKPGATVVVPTEPPSDGPTRLETLREISAIIASVATVWLVIDRTQ